MGKLAVNQTYNKGIAHCDDCDVTSFRMSGMAFRVTPGTRMLTICAWRLSKLAAAQKKLWLGQRCFWTRWNSNPSSHLALLPTNTVYTASSENARAISLMIAVEVLTLARSHLWGASFLVWCFWKGSYLPIGMLVDRSRTCASPMAIAVNLVPPVNQIVACLTLSVEIKLEEMI